MNDSMNDTVNIHYSIDHRQDCTGLGSETLGLFGWSISLLNSRHALRQLLNWSLNHHTTRTAGGAVT